VPVRAVYRFFKSVRLALVLILVIVGLSLLATLVPQARPDAWYQSRYSPPVHALIAFLGLEHLFGSPLFLLPVLLFSINLGTCTINRLVTRARNKARRRHGPDLVHVGLLVLIAAGLVTAVTWQEKTWQLASGEEATISPAYTVHLESLQLLKYDDGRPRDWISRVSVTSNGQKVADNFSLQVNHPLRLSGITLYQSSWVTQGIIGVRQPDGAMGSATAGEGFTEGDSFWYFAEVRQEREHWRAVFEQYKGKSLVSTLLLGPGDTVGPFAIERVSVRDVTGLKAVSDPGLAPFLAAIVLILAGLCLTWFQKRGEQGE
jgi:cytochrome c biogenesis protein ResB